MSVCRFDLSGVHLKPLWFQDPNDEKWHGPGVITVRLLRPCLLRDLDLLIFCLAWLNLGRLVDLDLNLLEACRS